MAKREWVGEYKMIISVLLSHSNEWITKTISLGKCLCWDEAREKSVLTLMRDYTGETVKPQYIEDGWGNRQYA